jgi:hypothetical protein
MLDTRCSIFAVGCVDRWIRGWVDEGRGRENLALTFGILGSNLGGAARENIREWKIVTGIKKFLKRAWI